MADDLSALAHVKSELRCKLRFRRDHHVATLPDFVRAVAFRAPPAPLRSLLENSVCVGGYVALASEAPVDGLFRIAAGKGAATALPAFSSRDAPMLFTAWNPGNTLVRGPWRVDQPADCAVVILPDLLLCPLLGFDRAGGRLGQGGGHYDRYFSAHPDALRIGVAWSVQEVDLVPTEAHDMMLDAVLTEQEWIVTGERL